MQTPFLWSIANGVLRRHSGQRLTHLVCVFSIVWIPNSTGLDFWSFKTSVLVRVWKGAENRFLRGRTDLVLVVKVIVSETHKINFLFNRLFPTLSRSKQKVGIFFFTVLSRGWNIWIPTVSLWKRELLLYCKLLNISKHIRKERPT